MDNAKVHHGHEIVELVEHFGTLYSFLSLCVLCSFSIGVRIEYLPPYSPDLNPIEEAFSKIKHFIRRHGEYYGTAVGNAIFFDMWEILEIITPNDAAGYFVHGGYF